MPHQSLSSHRHHHRRIKTNHLVSTCIKMASIISILTLAQAQSTPTISIATRYDIQDRPAAISLECNSDNGGTIVFLQWVTNGTVYQVTNEGTALSTLSFELTIAREGVYYCTVNGVRSSNNQTLVASPLPDLALRNVRRYSAFQGDNATLHCSYPIGQLPDRYQIEWYKGLARIQPGNAEFVRFEILGNFSLVVSDVEAADDSGYYCGVRVLVSPNNSVYVQSTSVRLEVVDPVRITNQLSDVAMDTEGSAHFICTATALPEPQITWLLKGAELSTPQEVVAVVDRSEEVVMVTSSLTLEGLGELDTGRVDCVAHHMMFGRVGVATAGANLVILSNSFQVTISARQDGGVSLKADLPAAIPGTFSLVVRYIYNPFTLVESELVDPAFKSTGSIDFTIIADKLPNFATFRMQVAVRATGVTGPFSEESNQITLSSEPPLVITDPQCQCPDDGTTNPNNGESYSSQTLLIVFIILVLIILTVAIVMTVLCIYFFIKREGTSSRKVYEVDEGESDVDAKSERSSRSRSNSDASFTSSGSNQTGSYVSDVQEEDEVYSEIPSSLPTTPLAKDRLPTEKDILELESRENSASNPSYVARYKKRKGGRRSHDHRDRSHDHRERERDTDVDRQVNSPDFSTQVPFT